jgi:microcystin-dependent protein
MSDPYIGEVRMFAGTTPPSGWALCNGQLMSINGNRALFSVLGTTYGGDGTSTFNLPNLQGSVAMGVSGAHPVGQAGGEAAHALNVSELAAHTHLMAATAAEPESTAVQNMFFAGAPMWAPPANEFAVLHFESVSNTGGGQAHPNMQPFLAIAFCIALNGYALQGSAA